MEFVTSEYELETTLDLLVQQVEEQSGMCDVTVRRGRWERKYHGCVLVASPFFDRILKNDFLEKRTGIISLETGYPASIDMALMHLYGIFPIFSENNIEDMFHLAEFFLLPTLKSACVKRLNYEQFSLDNCLHWFQLSRVYEFELPNCSQYIERHLNEIFAHPDALSLSYEFIDHVFKEERFCYFQMEQRLEFLMRWYKSQPEERTYFTEQLLESIAFEEIPPTSLHAIKCDIAADEILRDVGSNLDDVKRDVLIYKSSLCNKLGAIYDIKRNMWFRLNHFRRTAKYNIIGTNPDDSEVYWSYTYNYSHIKQCIRKLNVDNKKVERYELAHTYSGQEVRLSNVCHVSNMLCVNCTSAYEGDCVKFSYRPTLILIGKLVDQKVDMVPQFSIALSKVISVRVNKSGIIAMMLASRKHVLIYDTVECTLDKLEIETRENDKLCSTDNGFVIHDNIRCISIVRYSRQDLSTRYESFENEFDDGNAHAPKPKYKSALPHPRRVENYAYKYYFCNNNWYRLSINSPPRFQYAEHIAVVKAPSPDNVKWVDLLPLDELHDSLQRPKNMYHLKLSCRLSLCHLECPHCE